MEDSLVLRSIKVRGESLHLTPACVFSRDIPPPVGPINFPIRLISSFNFPATVGFFAWPLTLSRTCVCDLKVIQFPLMPLLLRFSQCVNVSANVC